MWLSDVVTTIEIRENKIVGYLLKMDHARGGPKGRFFLRFGFQIDDPATLERALREHGERHEIFSVAPHPTLPATVYTIRGAIRSPDGRDPVIQTIWQVDASSDRARFVTVIPR